MKKQTIPALLLTLALLLGLTACGAQTTQQTLTTQQPAQTQTEAPTQAPTEAPAPTEEPEPELEIIVFAAASMTETLNRIIELYRAERPNVTITPNYDSSGTLKTQIQEGAPCDLFISAGQKQMNQLDIQADPAVNTDGLDFVDPSSRINLLENKVTLVVPDGNPKGIESFDQLAGLLADGAVLMAMGNSDVPMGQYTQKILKYYELDEEAIANAGGITYGSNVKEVTTQVREGVVDCGVVYCTDAFSAGLTVVDSATAEMCGQVIYPASVLKTARQAEAAQTFLDYLTSPAAMAVFEAVGFSPVN